MPTTPTSELLTEAIKDARTKFPQGSGNKYRPGTSKTTMWDRTQRQAVADRNVNILRTKMPNYTDVWNYLDECERAKSGNCTEMALCAFRFLWKKDVRPMRVVELRQPGDHVFVVAGSLGGGTLANINSWGSDAFICDPWGNIACIAKCYRAKWMAKMLKWDADEKQLAYKGRFINLLEDEWLLAIKQHDILPFVFNNQYEIVSP